MQRVRQSDATAIVHCQHWQDACPMPDAIPHNTYSVRQRVRQCVRQFDNIIALVVGFLHQFWENARSSA